MNIESFINNLYEQYELDEGEMDLRADTKYKEVDDWDSLVALSVIAMVDDEYSVTIDGDAIRGTSTVQELYDLVKQKAEQA